MTTIGSTSRRSRRITGSRLLAAIAAAALAGSLLVSCTTTAGKPEAAASAGSTSAGGTAATSGASPAATAGTAATQGAGSPGTGSTAATTAQGSGSSGTGGTQSAPAGDTDTSPQIPPVTYQTDPDEVALEKVLPGMYGLDSLGATVSGSKIAIDAPASCAFVLEVLNAGQWSITDLVKPTKTSKAYTATLTNGTTRAVLSLTDTGTACQGMIVAPESATLTVTGALSVNGPAALYPLTCPSGGGTDPIPMYAVYATDTATYLVAIGVVPTKGTHTAKGTDDSDDAEMLFYQTSKKPDLGPALTAIEQLTNPTTEDSGSSDTSGDSDASIPPGWDAALMFGTGPATSMTVTVSSVDPLQGTVTATKVANPTKSSSTISLTATFSCGG